MPLGCMFLLNFISNETDQMKSCENTSKHHKVIEYKAS